MNFYYKKFSAEDVNVIKDGKKDIELDATEEELKELEELEKMDRFEQKNSNDEEI